MATTTTPNKLTQVHQYVWYGTCESDLCDDEIFDEWGTKLYDINQNVIEISTYEDGILKTFRPDGKYGSNTGPGIGQLDRFKCGYMYAITLKKNGSIDMENMYPSNAVSIAQKYGISTTCSALGDIGLTCVPEGYTSFYYRDAEPDVISSEKEGEEVVNRVDVYAIAEGGKNVLCNQSEGQLGCNVLFSFMWNFGDSRDANAYISLNLDDLKFGATDSNDAGPISVNLKVGTSGNERLLGYLTLQTLPDTATEVLLYENGTCYKAVLSDVVQNANETTLIMKQEWSSSTLCTYSDPDSDNPLVFEAFEVGPSFAKIDDGIIIPEGFLNDGDLKIPPANTSGITEDSTILLKYYTSPSQAIGQITYKGSLPANPYVYFFARTGPFIGKCMFGVINGTECILGE